MQAKPRIYDIPGHVSDHAYRVHVHAEGDYEVLVQTLRDDGSMFVQLIAESETMLEAIRAIHNREELIRNGHSVL